MDENKVTDTLRESETVQTPEPAQESEAVQAPEIISDTSGGASVKDAPSENVLAGIVGAFLFSLAGGVLWYVLYQVGFIAGISAIVGVIAAIKGYELFSKKATLRGVVISVVIAALVLVIAWYLCLSTDVYMAYGEWYAAGDIDFEITFFEAIRNAYIFLSEPEIATSYLLDLGIGIVFGIIGCVRPIREAVAKTKAQQ